MSRVATIGQTAAAVPEHVLPQAEIKRALAETLDLPPARLEALMVMFDHAGVERRYGVLPISELRRPRSLSDTMSLYRQEAVRLGRQVAAECLARGEARPTDVDLVITVSCTGFMIPSLDAHLVNDLGLRPDVRRLPITELGCLAGAAALAHARDFIAAHPEASVLVVSVELPTLSFQRRDLSPASLVSAALFGDGAAAVLLTGRPSRGAAIVAAQSHLFPSSIGTLGFDLQDDGFHVVLGPELPELVRAQAAALVRRLLDEAHLDRAALTSFVLHPGGRRVLEALESELGLGPEDARPSWNVLRDYGNLSSAAVLFVLHHWFHRRRPPAGSHGLLGAFGPGFSSELMVLRWN